MNGIQNEDGIEPHTGDGTMPVSRLFSPYRTVGLVSPTKVPFTSIALGKTTFQITTSIGRSLQTYDLRRGLNLVFITRPQTPGHITAIVAWKDYVFAAWSGRGSESIAGSGVWAFKRGKRVAELLAPRPVLEDIIALTIFGSWIVGVTNTHLHVWTTSTLDHYASFQTSPGVAFTPNITTLPTLLNKVLVGKSDGTVELWNVSTGKLVYSVTPASTDCGAVTTLQPVPVLSLVAIGYEHGAVAIHDVRADNTVLSFTASEGASSVSSIAFRTDGLGAGDDGSKPGVMATSCVDSGDVTMWDLNNGGRKTGVLRGAHTAPSDQSDGGITRVEFLPGQAIMVSSGPDNSLKTWIFDESPFSAVPRPLHSRSGHAGPVTNLLFLPSASDGSDISGKWLMAGSKDRSLWGWSLRRDGQSTELSQGAIKKKAKKIGLLSAHGRDSIQTLRVPPVTSIACSLNRDGGVGAVPGKQPVWLHQNQRKGLSTNTESSTMTGWESVVTAHEGENQARTWFWGRKRAGRWALPTSDSAVVSSIAMSPCGTFALLGSASGSIDMFNLQSGIHRQRFPPRLTPKQAQKLKHNLLKSNTEDESDDKQHERYFRGQGKHVAAVTGLAVDNLNRTVISCSADGRVKFWAFATGALAHEIDWSSAALSITGLILQRSSELAAFKCSDGAIRVLDTTSRKIVRELRVSRSPSNPCFRCDFGDIGFSQDSAWIAAAVGSLVCVWDLPTGHLIDAFKLADTCTALSFSPTGEYLATAHASSVGIDIWTNRTLFTHVPARRMSEEELVAILESDLTVQPTASGEQSEQLLNTSQALTRSDELEDNEDLSRQLTKTDVSASLSSELLSMSLVPRSRWQNLLHMDVIRARNKPIEPPKKPEKAPFFLPSLQQQEANETNKSQGLLSSSNEVDESQALATLEMERSRIARMDRAGGRSDFSRLLRQCSQPTSECVPFVELLKSLAPAAADIEIRSLSTEHDEMLAFVRALSWVSASKCDFELGQTWMAVFLRIHGDVVVNDANVRAAVAEWRDALRTEKERITSMAEYCAGIVEYLRAGRV